MKKQKLKNSLKLGILIFGIALFFTNCEKENITPIEETNKNLEEESVFIEEVSISQIPQVKHFLDKNPVTSKSKTSKENSSKNDETYFGEVDFSKILKLTDSLGQVTYTFRMIKPNSTTEEKIGFYFDNLTIAVEDNNENYSAYILRYFYGEETKTPDYNYQGLSGHIERFPLTETSFGLDFINSSLFAKEECKYTVKTDCGRAGHHESLTDPGCSSNILTVTIHQECFDTGVKVASTGNYSTDTNGEPSFGGGGRRGSTTPIISPYDERDLGILDGIRNILNLTSSEYTWLYSKYSTAMTIWNFLENDASIEAKYFAKSAIETLIDGGDVDFDDQIINTLTGKAKCIYDKLKEINNNLFKKTIGEFIDDPEYNLILQNGNCSTTNDACTNANDINNIVITIEDVNQSGLGIAALILHEGIHAEIHRFVSRYESGVDPNNRPRLFQLYAYYKGWAESTQDENYNWTQDAHHQYMVENYVNQIASAIRELDNNRYPISYYMAYGWDGLTKYGYTSKKLSESQNNTNQNLRAVANENTLICN